jgi:hypothetical protein
MTNGNSRNVEGSESPDSDRSEGKRNVDSDPVKNVDSSSSNVMNTERNQGSSAVLSAHNCYNALYLPVPGKQGNININ